MLGMHIMEGFLPPYWALFWWALAVPFLVLGVRAVVRRTAGSVTLKLLLAMAGALALVLSALKLPSVAGSCAHPTGVALGAILAAEPEIVLLDEPTRGVDRAQKEAFMRYLAGERALFDDFERSFRAALDPAFAAVVANEHLAVALEP